MDMDSPASAKIKIMELKRINRLMKNEIFDIKSTNNDLLKGSLHQYTSAVQSRREAWIGGRNELRSTDYLKPAQTD